MKTWFLAVSMNSWGRGETVADAERNLRGAGGNTRTMLVYAFDQSDADDPPYVDGMGNTVSACRDRSIVKATKKGRTIDPATVK